MAVNGKPLRRRRRIWIFIAIALSPFLIVFVATRSFVLSPILSTVLSNVVEADIHVGSSRIGISGNVTLHDVSLKAEGISGPASDVVTLSTVHLQLDSPIPFGSVGVESVEIESVVLRLAESSEKAGDFNFLHIDISSGEDDTLSEDTTQENFFSMFSDFTLEKIRIESGVMSHGEWILDSDMEFAIEFLPNKEDLFKCKITDLQHSTSPEISIMFSDKEVHAEVNDVSFKSSIFNLLPRTVRVWRDRSKLRGGLQNLSVDWLKGQEVVTKATIEKIQFLLPEEYGLRWTHYDGGEYAQIRGDAVLDVEKGEIVYNGNSLELKDIEGDLFPPHRETSVAFSGGIEISDLPHLGKQEGDVWMDSLLSTAPFKAKFFIDDFRPTENGEAELPLAASQILSLFQLENWNMDTKVSIVREVQNGEIKMDGELIIRGASGAYSGFQYPLSNISSNIKFDNEKYTIVFLNATGSEDATVHISGEVFAPEDDLEVRLHIHAKDAPLDQALHEALPDSIANVMDKLLDQEAFEKMTEVLTEPELKGVSLGGLIDLDLEIFHKSRFSEAVEVSGEISVKNVGVVHSVFPFPLNLKSGRVLLDQTGIYIPDGEVIRFEGPGGGDGRLTGSVLFEKNDAATPHFTISLDHEDVTSALVHAVSFSVGDSHDFALEVLSGLGLDARMSVEGDVEGNMDGEIDTSFNATLRNGTAVLQPSLAEAIHATGAFWPEGLALKNVDADIEIVNGAVVISNATCQCKDGSIEAAMSIDKETFELSLLGKNLPITSRFVDVLPPSASESLAKSWNMLEPGGVMDAKIKISRIDGVDELLLDIEPTELTVSGKGEKVTLSLEHGSIHVKNTTVSLLDLRFGLQMEGSQEGILELGGTIQGNVEDFTYDLNANWSEAEIASPLTRAITGIVGGSAGMEYYDSLEPTGLASATLRAINTGSLATYTVEISPSILQAKLHSYTAKALFDQSADTKNIIRFTESGISFDNLDGSLGEGKFTIDTPEESDRIINLTWKGPSDDESLFAVLPSRIGETLAAIDLTGGQSELNNGQFQLVGEKWTDLDVSFAGDIELEGVSIDVGIPLKEINGKINVDAIYIDDKLSDLTLELTVDEMAVLGRSVTDVAGKMIKDVQNNRLVFEELGGDSTTGGVALEGWMAIDGTNEFELEVFVADARIAAKEGDDALASLEGKLTSWLSISGTRGVTASRRGVGIIRVREGHLMLDSTEVNAMQLMNLSLPSSESITGADIDLYIDGDTIVIDTIKLMGDETSFIELVLTGEGTVDIDTFTLQARLHPRVGLPIVRDIAGALNDQLYVIDVSGELFNPNVSVVALPFLSPQEK